MSAWIDAVRDDVARDCHDNGIKVIEEIYSLYPSADKSFDFWSYRVPSGYDTDNFLITLRDALDNIYPLIIDSFNQDALDDSIVAAVESVLDDKNPVYRVIKVILNAGLADVLVVDTPSLIKWAEGYDM